MSTSTEVSIICLTYNHGELLRQSLDSMINQITDFDYEIIVHDDCSMDGTTDILREYAKRYPNLIVPIYEDENQYASGRRIVREMTNDTAKGKYIAFCEGDDYWLDNLKLQKQYDAMESHPQVDLCAGRGVVVDAITGNRIGLMRPKEHECIIPVQDVIAGGGQYFASASLFFRRSALSVMSYEFEKVMELDYVWQIKGSLRGGAYYIDDEMAAYRSGVEGAWSTRMEKDAHLRTEHFNRMVSMLETLDKETDYKYHEAVAKRVEMGQKAEMTFFDQLEMNKNEIEAVLGRFETIYLWGNGKRGMAFQRFCKKHDIQLRGICDALNESIGNATPFGFTIVDTDEVKHSDGLIVASNQIVFDAINNMDISAHVVNLQQYIKYE
ncbi:glycosyltransferase [Selenomonas ruminantium]|uniref:Glycosyl transferase family 2 n=1 Tax=Selenomonas ruminantium TaxID=971 RepID=A0A1H0S2T2_SELRU|nr:glycosyltransferase [Selenomonas ruminantium]SDP36010.1 Glycosyl transferase family 2 [Selenomonas ruminantium]